MKTDCLVLRSPRCKNPLTEGGHRARLVEHDLLMIPFETTCPTIVGDLQIPFSCLHPDQYRETRRETMSDLPRIAGRQPVAVTLEEGKKYAFCTCGVSANQPFCDGSHTKTSFSPHIFVAEKSAEAHLCMCKRSGNIPFCDGTHSTIDVSKS